MNEVSYFIQTRPSQAEGPHAQEVSEDDFRAAMMAQPDAPVERHAHAVYLREDLLTDGEALAAHRHNSRAQAILEFVAKAREVIVAWDHGKDRTEELRPLLAALRTHELSIDTIFFAEEIVRVPSRINLRNFRNNTAWYI